VPASYECSHPRSSAFGGERGKPEGKKGTGGGKKGTGGEKRWG